ncbi:MAG: hypothetical protein ACM3JD_15490, partial [Rudaea sp.]
FLLFVLLAGCSLQQAAVEPTPVGPNINLPPTWTPQPTATPGPPPPTATRVIPVEPVSQNAPAVSNQPYRHFPQSVFGKIGLWGDTRHLTVDQSRLLSDRVQIVSGPQALSLRRLNARLFALAVLDGSLPRDQLLKSLPSYAQYDAVLLDPVGLPESANSASLAAQLLAAAKPALGSRLLFAGSAEAARSQSAQVDGVCLCRFLRAGDDKLDTFKTVAEWKKDVDSLTALASLPNSLVLVATRLNKVESGQSALVDRWFNYSFPSFLLGVTGGTSYFSFQGSGADNYLYQDATGVQLGYAYGSYYPFYGAYVRQFQNGMVAVNPGMSLVEIPLSRTYVSANGLKLTRVKLDPHSGIILLAQK